MPQSGDPRHPKHWVNPPESGAKPQAGKPADPAKAPGKPAAPAASAKGKRTAEKKPTEKAARAKAAHVMTDKTVQRYAEEHVEPQFAKSMGGVSFPNGEPVDVALPGKGGGKVGHGVELKTMVLGGKAEITMNAYAQVRKKCWERDNKAAFHTVVVDDRKVFGAGEGGAHDEAHRVYYYRRGIAGSAQVTSDTPGGGMYEVKGGLKELKKLIDTPDDKLPPQAQRKEKVWLTAGVWKPLPGGGRGYVNSETGQIVVPKK